MVLHHTSSKGSTDGLQLHGKSTSRNTLSYCKQCYMLDHMPRVCAPHGTPHCSCLDTWCITYALLSTFYKPWWILSVFPSSLSFSSALLTTSSSAPTLIPAKPAQHFKHQSFLVMIKPFFISLSLLADWLLSTSLDCGHFRQIFCTYHSSYHSLIYPTYTHTLPWHI